MILVVFLYAVLASTFIFAKKAVTYANPFFLIGFRMLLAGGLLIGYQRLFGRKHIQIQRKDWLDFFKASLFHIYFAFLLEFWALQYVSALKTTIIYTSTPFIAAILSYFLLKERLTKNKIIGMLVGLGGLLPVILSQTSEVEATLECCRISLPEVILFLAVLSSTYAWFIVKSLMHKGYSFGLINGVSMFVGGVLSLITTLIVNGVQNPVYDTQAFIFWVLLLIISANFLFYNLYAFLLKRYSITFLTFCGFLSPCFGTLFDWIFLSGALQIDYLVAVFLITSGLYLFYRDELTHAKT